MPCSAIAPIVSTTPDPTSGLDFGCLTTIWRSPRVSRKPSRGSVAPENRCTRNSAALAAPRCAVTSRRAVSILSPQPFWIRRTNSHLEWRSTQRQLRTGRSILRTFQSTQRFRNNPPHKDGQQRTSACQPLQTVNACKAAPKPPRRASHRAPQDRQSERKTQKTESNRSFWTDNSVRPRFAVKKGRSKSGLFSCMERETQRARHRQKKLLHSGSAMNRRLG